MNRILTRFELLEKRLKIQANRETNRASQRRNSSAARSAKRAQRKRKREAETARYNGNTTTAKSSLVPRPRFSQQRMDHITAT